MVKAKIKPKSSVKAPSKPKQAKPKAVKKKKTFFGVGDYAVYPNHGVGMIQSLENKEIAGDVMPFYVMRILDSELTVMIPMEHATTYGLREIIPASQVKAVYKVFEHREVVIDTTTWNRRSREYTEKIKTGSVFEIAEVLRDLYVLKKTKTLSFGERKTMDTSRTLLIKELAFAKSVSEDEIEKDIQKIFEG